MHTPLMRTADTAPRQTPITRYERALAVAVSAAVAAVAALALLAPTPQTVSSGADSSSVVVTGQTARGKATLPGQTAAPAEQSPTTS